MNEQQVTHLMSNDELNTWADIFAQAKVADLLSITFSEFLEAPFTHLASAGQDTALDCMITGFRPLMPAQVRAAQKIHQQWGNQGNADKPSRGHLSLVVS